MTQNGMPFALGRRAGGWFGAERGSYEFALKPGPKGTLQVDLGAGRVLAFRKLGKRSRRAGRDSPAPTCRPTRAAVWRHLARRRGLEGARSAAR